MSTRYFLTQIRVRSCELDSFGHVNNAVYLQYLEAARCDYMRQVEIAFSDFKKNNAFPVVVDAELHYRHPLITDDLIEIKGWFSEWKKASFLLDYEINKKDQTPVLTARLKFAMVNYEGKIIRVPDFFRIPFSCPAEPIIPI